MGPQNRFGKHVNVKILPILVVVVAYVVWFLCIPAWPSQDGPMHLYYTHILGQLLSHQPTVYARYYFVKHILPPYALYYYALLALSKFVPLLLADRLILCAYVVSFIFGFRFLARALGPSADEMTLLASLLLLNWPLAMGFVNFCLSLSFVFWALGLWLRFQGADPWRRIGFVVLAVLAMFTHPVPLLALLGIAAFDLALRTGVHLRSNRSLQPGFFRDLWTFVPASLTLVYVKLFTNSHPLAQSSVAALPGSLAERVYRTAEAYAAEKGLAFLLGPGFEPRLYRAILAVAIVLPLALAIAQLIRNRRERRWTAADTVLAMSVFAIVILPFIPHDLNGSHFFADRLLLFAWLLPILAASGYVFRRPPYPMLIAGFVLCAQIVILHEAAVKILPAARTMAAVARTSGPIAASPGRLVLVLDDPRPAAPPSGLSFDPRIGISFDVLRHDNAVLANTPWLDLAIIPLGATPALPSTELSPEALEFPSILREQLTTDGALRRRVLSQVDTVAIDQSYRTPSTELDPLLTADPENPAEWRCHLSGMSWLRLCERSSPAAP